MLLFSFLFFSFVSGGADNGIKTHTLTRTPPLGHLLLSLPSSLFLLISLSGGVSVLPSLPPSVRLVGRGGREGGKGVVVVLSSVAS